MDFSAVLMVGVENESGSTIITGQWRRPVDFVYFYLICVSLRPSILAYCFPRNWAHQQSVSAWHREQIGPKKVEMFLK